MPEYKVLIVEDDPMVAMINEQYITKNHNFKVTGSCRNGQEALDFLENNKVDLIVLDVFMPYMDGIETLKKIREKNIESEVIMVTAANDTSTLEQTINYGVIDYLIKPFAMERFLVALEKFTVKVSALNQKVPLDQSSIDSIISGKPKITDNQKTVYPKGIQKKTLSMILNYFEENTGWHTGDMIAEKLGVSIVTIRHYMNYMADNNLITQDINYETGGRPCMMYKNINSLK